MRAVLATVIGPSGQRDLSLPAELPTAELLPTLTRLLGGQRPAHGGPPRGPHPAPSDGAPGGPPGAPGARPAPAARGWTLLNAAGDPIPPWASLAERGVLHGEFLYLVAEPPPPPQLRHPQP